MEAWREELYHHGVKGQRWGVRRYQNDYGSLKPAGEKRYGATSVKAGANRAMAKIYAMNEKVYRNYYPFHI